jgi:hypothetical protein
MDIRVGIRVLPQDDRCSLADGTFKKVTSNSAQHCDKDHPVRQGFTAWQ